MKRGETGPYQVGTVNFGCHSRTQHCGQGGEVKRRTFLGSLGLVGSIGVEAAARSKRATPLRVVVWFSERATRYDGLRTRITGYLERALAPTNVGVRVSFGDRPIPLDEEQGADLMAVEWPRRVLTGTLGLGSIGVTGDVTLLITDGDPSSRPAGYGMSAVAAMTGARLLAKMPPPDETPTVVPPTGPAVITQLLLHECGHALGLGHRHGTVTVSGDEVIASPMVGAYAWAHEDVRRRQLGRGTNVCGRPYPVPGSRNRRLRLEYGPCSFGVIRGYRDGPLP